MGKRKIREQRRKESEDLSKSRIALKRSKTERLQKSREKAIQILATNKKSDSDRLASLILNSSYKSDESLRVKEMIEIINNKCPRLLYNRYFSALRFLSKSVPWIRDIQEWDPKGKGKDTVFRSLVDHLLVTYRMPKFFYGVFFRDPCDENFVKLFIYLAQGGSLKKVVGTELIPVPFTKKMCHSFLNTSADVEIFEAIRGTQIKAFGGEPKLLKALLRTPLGRTLHTVPYEKFWETVIQWLCKNPMLDPAQVGPLYDYISFRRREDNSFSIVGRSVLAMLRGMEEWHKELYHQKKLKGSGNFPVSGYANKFWSQEQRVDGKKVTIFWEIREILSAKELSAEGRTMRHCVSSYSYRIEKGDISIWSLRKNDERQVTIALYNKNHYIQEVRGFGNRLATNSEMAIVKTWAREEGFKIGAYGF